MPDMAERQPLSLLNKIRRARRAGTTSVIRRHEIPELCRILEDHDDRKREAAKKKAKCVGAV